MAHRYCKGNHSPHHVRRLQTGCYHHIIPELGRRKLKELIPGRYPPSLPQDGRDRKTPTGGSKESSALDPAQEVKALFAAASEYRFEALYVVAIHTGLRRGELPALKRTDVDLDAGALTVRRSLDLDGAFKAPKNRAAKRTLKVTPQALDAFKAHKVR